MRIAADTFEVGTPMSVTAMACIADPAARFEHAFMSALNIADRWSLAGSTLRQSGPGTVMTFSR